MTSSATSVTTRDAAYQLHPFANLRKHETEGPLVITGGLVLQRRARLSPEEEDHLARARLSRHQTAWRSSSPIGCGERTSADKRRLAQG
jgi:hypothetical protein